MRVNGTNSVILHSKGRSKVVQENSLFSVRTEPPPAIRTSFEFGYHVGHLGASTRCFQTFSHGALIWISLCEKRSASSGVNPAGHLILDERWARSSFIVMTLLPSGVENSTVMWAPGATATFWACVMSRPSSVQRAGIS